MSGRAEAQKENADTNKRGVDSDAGWPTRVELEPSSDERATPHLWAVELKVATGPSGHDH
jgi:hypothetical protein